MLLVWLSIFVSPKQTIPYLGPIYGGLREGVSIYIQGSVPEDITRFFVNLLCGEAESSDIALHFNPRFDGWDKVVFNSCQNGSWESEEKIRSMPFSKGEAFEMVIVVTSQGYQIRVNGNDFHTFEHRMPVERVRAMQIAGDVSIQTINVIGVRLTAAVPVFLFLCGFIYIPCNQLFAVGSSAAIKFQFSCTINAFCSAVCFQPVPYSNMIPGGMFPKRTIIIRGMVPYGADRCVRSRDIAFHMNPRVREGMVVRNSMIGGNWGQEERELSLNPFMEGQYFDMSIRCGNQRFKVFVNGQHLFDFFHRLQSFNEIDVLEIEGDIDTDDVGAQS
uniref:Galectin n=1 Tax=Sparus aurata TaxID=8175 RepID=A0A671WYV6_SPAAU